MQSIGKDVRRNGLQILLGLLLAAGPGIGAAEDAQTYLGRGEALYQKGEYKGAVIELKNALQKDPSLARARQVLGQVYLAAGDTSAAEQELQRAQSLGLDDVTLKIDLAEVRLRQGRHRDALEQLDRLSGDAGGSVRVLTLKGWAYMGLDREEDARKSLEQALAQDPAAGDAVVGMVQLDLKNKDQAGAARRLDAHLQRVPDDSKAMLVRAELYRSEQQYDKAIELYDRMLEAAPNDGRAFVGRAASRIALRQFDKAKADLAKLEEVSPGAVMGEYLRGLLAFFEQDFKAARDSMQKVLSASPGHIQSQFLHGLVSFQLGEYQIAEEYLGRAVAAMPGNLQAVKVLAAVRIKQKEPDKAIELLKPYAGEGSDAQILALLGSAYLLKGDQEHGGEALARAVELAPDMAALRTQLAVGLLAGGDTAGAVDQLRSAVDLGQDILQADVLLVLAYLKSQKFEQALEASMALEKRMADSPIPYNLTGLAYLAKGDDAKAAQRFEKALAVDPGFLTAATNLAKIDLKKGDLAGADKRFQRILEKDPKDIKALLGLAQIAEKRGDRAALLGWLEKARDASPQSPQPGLLLAAAHLSLGEPLKALREANDLNSRFPRTPAVLEVLGKAQVAAGEYANAVRTFERLVETHPVADVYLLLGGARNAAKDTAGARRSFERAVELSPDHLRARLALAILELQDKRLDAALVAAKEIQARWPDQPAGFEVEGGARIAKREPELAVRAYEKAYGLQQNALLAQRLAQAHQASGHPEKGLEVLKGWVAKHPEDLDTRFVLAMTLQALGRNPDAIREYEAVSSKRPGQAVLLNNLAWLYFVEKDPRALETGRTAYDLDPSRAEVADTYGWILLHQGKDPEKALNILQQAYVTFPTNAEIGYHVGVAQHRAGRKDEAVRTLRRVLSENPNFSEAEAARRLLKEVGG